MNEKDSASVNPTTFRAPPSRCRPHYDGVAAVVPDGRVRAPVLAAGAVGPAPGVQRHGRAGRQRKARREAVGLVGFVVRYASELRLSIALERNAKAALQAALEDGYGRGADPSCLAAAALYAAGHSDLVQAEVCGVSTVSIQTHYPNLADYL